MAKIHIILSFKRSKAKKQLQSAILFMALCILICSFAIGSENILHKDLKRYIFKFHNLQTASNFKSTLIKEIRFYYPDINLDSINEYFDNNEIINPRDLVRFIEKNISKSNDISFDHSNDIREMTRDEWSEYVKKAELYVVFASENGHKSESSVGHLAFLYDFEDVSFFDNIVTYYAVNYSETARGNLTINSYLKGAFGKLDGNFINYPFHDALYDYLILEDRIISKYKLNLDKSQKEKIDNAIWEINQNSPKYNFFNRNCAFELMTVLGSIFSFNEKYLFTKGYIIRTPAELIRRLKSKEIITYDGSYRYTLRENNKVEIVFDKDAKYDTAIKSYAQQFSISFDKAASSLGFSIFQSSRPYNGLSKRKSNVALLDFRLLVSQSNKLNIEFTPVKFKYYFPILNNAGIKIDLNRLDDKWNYSSNSGMYFDWGAIRTEISSQFFINNSQNRYNFQIFYSNQFLDIMLGKNNMNGDNNLFCGVELFLTNNVSINLSSDLSIKNFGISYYR